MTATNHALTGTVIGFVIGQPLLAIPLSFASHFVCDAIPHFGSLLPDKIWLRSKRFQRLLIADAAICVVIVLWLADKHPAHWLLAALCAFTATSPDLFHINQFRKIRSKRVWRPNQFSRFAGRIQWFQRPIGIVVEAAWLVAALLVVKLFI